MPKRTAHHSVRSRWIRSRYAIVRSRTGGGRPCNSTSLGGAIQSTEHVADFAPGGAVSVHRRSPTSIDLLAHLGRMGLSRFGRGSGQAQLRALLEQLPHICLDLGSTTRVVEKAPRDRRRSVSFVVSLHANPDARCSSLAGSRSGCLPPPERVEHFLKPRTEFDGPHRPAVDHRGSESAVVTNDLG